jgi:hypothetical protein
MALTKTDLQQIGNVVDERLEVGLEEKLEQKFNEKLEPFEKRLEKKLEQKFNEKLTPIKKDLKYIRKTVEIIVKDYDERDVRLSKRVSRIEQHLALPKEN